jgi:predicted TIM-barrel fold metal-dependent hydrolase
MNLPVDINRRTFISAGCLGFGSLMSGCAPQWSEPQPQKARSSKARVSRVVDTHIHFYDLRREGGVVLPKQKDKLLYHAVLPKDFLKTAESHGVRESILVEASSRIEDNQWLLDLADESPSILGVVGNLPVGDLEFRGNLELFAKNPLFRGIRIREKELVDFSGASYVEDLWHIAAQGLSVDVLGGPAMLPNIVKLAETVPTLRIIINHFPFDISTNPFVRDAAERAMENLATRPNVFAKVSSIVRKLAPEFQHAATYRSRLDHLWKTFGSNRLLYGSNWPVSDHIAPYSTAIDILKEYLAEMSSEQSEKFFWRNSRVAYNWKGRG